MTKREAILQAVKTILETISGVDVYRSRPQAFTLAESPAVHLAFTRDIPEQISLPIIDWTLQVKVSVLARGDVPDSLADVIVKDVHVKLLADPSLGGLAMDVQPAQVDFQLIAADKNAGIVNCDFVILYRTQLADLTA